MKRSLTVNYQQNQQEGFAPGDAAAHRAAAALADRADMPTIDFLSTLLSLLETIGGQGYATALRVENESGEFDTMGLILNYETRDARIEFFKAPDEVAGVPVTDSAGPGTKVAVEGPDSTACPICGRENPAERPEDPPCQCQVEMSPDEEPEDESAEDEPAEKAREPEPALTD